MTHSPFVIQLQTYFLIKTIKHNIHSRIKWGTCSGLLIHYQALIQNINNTFNTVIGARSPPAHAIIHYMYLQVFENDL